MTLSLARTPVPYNEPIRGYMPGSPERAELKEAYHDLKNQQIEIPIIIGGREIRTGSLGECRVPHDHSILLGKFHQAGEKEVALAIEAAAGAKKAWAAMSWEDRASIFLRAAELLAHKWRATVNAATMLNQSKNMFQAEIDSACELIDFLRFNVYYMTQIISEQPGSDKMMWNRLDYRPLEGFCFAVTPFNFTSIAGNLPTSCALMGNTVLWKPASSAVFSGYKFMQLLMEAGLPEGVINFLPGSGGKVGNPIIKHPDLAGVHFTGSTATFQNMWRTIGENIASYRTYPRIVGETGGKDFILAHKSANLEALVVATVRGAFEYQGQKCSAASRAYIPSNLWPQYVKRVQEETARLKVGDVIDPTTFMGAVIDEAAFKSITAYIDYAKNAPDAEIIAGGGYDSSKGWFIQPTVIATTNPKFKTMVEEIFGPVITIYKYPENEWRETLKLLDETSPYALTGAVFSNDRYATIEALEELRNAAGNFYINDKPTGAVVGQQPFGGARASGTNDKAGSALNLMRWTSPRAIKENFLPPETVAYPYMKED